MGRSIWIAVGLGFALVAGAARAGDEAEALRREKVRRLAASSTEQALAGLARVVLADSSESVRLVAARGLAHNKAKHAPKVLCDLIQKGGTPAVRHELALSLAAQEEGLAQLHETLDASWIDDLGRSNLVSALGSFGGSKSLTALQQFATNDDPVVRVAALDALERREDGKAMLPAVVDLALGRYRDESTVLRGLELMEGFDLDGMEVCEHLLQKVRRATTVRNVGYLKKRLKFLRAAAEYKRTKGTRYEIPKPYEPEPPVWERHDLVFAFDATGSEGEYLPLIREKIWEEVLSYRAEGIRVRIGFVVYRDTLRDANQRAKGWEVRMFPLTSDHRAARDWLEGVGAGGVDTQGSLISKALFHGLARMNWRHDSRKRFDLITSTHLDNVSQATKLVRLYVKNGDIGMRMRYRPRGITDNALRRLAKLGGGDHQPLGL